MEIVDIKSQLDNTATCAPHPDRGSSFVLCTFGEVSEEEVFSDFVVLLLIDFLCIASTKSGVVGEATIWPESDLQCSTASPEVQFSAVSVDHFDVTTDPITSVEDFTCPQGEDATFSDSEFCASAEACSSSSASCMLGATTSMQRTPIPVAAFFSSLPVPDPPSTAVEPSPSSPAAAPKPPSPAVAPRPVAPVAAPPSGGEGSTSDVVGYQATFLQKPDNGCSGFSPVAEVACSNGGQLTFVSILSEDDRPTCAVDSSGSTATCVFPTIDPTKIFNGDDFSVAVSIAFKCSGGGPLGEPLGEAHFLPDLVECPRDAFVATSTSIRYFDLLYSSYVSEFSCLKGAFPASSRDLCYYGAFCAGGSCISPSTAARQKSPIPAAAFMSQVPTTVASAEVPSLDGSHFDTFQTSFEAAASSTASKTTSMTATALTLIGIVLAITGVV